MVTIEELEQRHPNVTIHDNGVKYIVKTTVYADVANKNSKVEKKRVDVTSEFDKNEYNLMDIQNYIIGGTEKMNYEKYFAVGTKTKLTYKKIE